MVAALATVPLAVFLVTTREEDVLGALYEMVFGSPDLGPVRFETLDRDGRRNDALACPPGYCRAPADFDPGVYAAKAEELREIMTRYILLQPRTVPLFRSVMGANSPVDRYLQRSRLMQFPDTINIQYIELSETTSTVAIYSRSQIGRSDFGVNLARIRQWTDRSALGFTP
jgi:uncharacterized protein (DUF1499 family)